MAWDADTFRRNKAYIILFLTVLAVILAIIPLYRQAIICNDELQTRYWAGLGFDRFYEHYHEAWVSQGRMLAASISSVTMYLGFLSQDRAVFRIEQIAVLVSCSLLFGLLIRTMFKDRYFAVFCSVSFLVLLPITFEHTLPNAFVSFIGIPVMVVLLSMILFIRFIDKGNYLLLFVSMILFFAASVSYEAFVTMAPIYSLLAISRNVSNGESRRFKGALWPIIVGCAFFAVYIISSIVFPSSYEGNKIARPIDIANSIDIISTLFLTNLPGFYYTSPKYQWMMDSIGNTGDPAFVVRALVLLVLFVALLAVLAWSSRESGTGERKKHLVPIAIAILVAVFPFIPTSVSSMYQDMVGESGFLALPASFISFFGVVFIICYILWNVFRDSKSLHLKIAVVVMAFVFIGPTQMANDIYSEEQLSDFDRLEYIEDFVRSDGLYTIGGDEYRSPDLYVQYHLLGFIGDYWTDYSREYGNGILLPRDEPASGSEDRIYFDGERTFQIWHAGSLTLMSKSSIPESLQVRIIDDVYGVATVTGIDEVGGWYVASCSVASI